jgi:glutamate dehydrogenase (NADP+)
MFGQYKKVRNVYEGVLTGKGLTYGGSLVRTEATGYGLVYFMEEALKDQGKGFDGATVVISGSGNVSIYAVEKAQQLGAKVVAVSDSNGYIYDKNGIDLKVLKQLKEVERRRIKDYLEFYPQVSIKKVLAVSGPSLVILPCLALLRMNWMRRQLKLWLPTAVMLSVKVPICLQLLKLLRCSTPTKFSLLLAKPPMPVV